MVAQIGKPAALTLARILDRHIGQRAINVHDIADAAHVSSDTAERWVNGDLRPSCEPYAPNVFQFQRMMKKLPEAVRIDLLNWFGGECNCGVLFTETIDEADLDLDGDGRTTTNDFLEAVTCAAGEAHQAATTQAIHAASDRLITPEEDAMLNPPIAKTSKYMDVARAILQKIRLRPC